MEVQHWGPAGWQFLHAISFGYPEQPTLVDKNHALNFFKSVGHVLPCDKCRSHYNDQVCKTPPDVENRESLSRWLVRVHNKVNRENGKKEWNYSDVKQQHALTLKDLGKKCVAPPPSNNDYVAVYVLIVIIVGVSMWALRR